MQKGSWLCESSCQHEMTKPSTNPTKRLTSVKKTCRKEIIDLLSTNDTKLFDAIDPLLSDNQCQVHSLFVLSILLKCYRPDNASYDIMSLDENDIETLSDAAFLTSIKIDQADGFGVVLRQKSLEHFGGSLDSRKNESKFIARVKERFNGKSVDFMRSIAEGSVKRILDDCVASIPHSKIKLKILPCYATVYALMAYVRTKRLPILIALKRIELRDCHSGSRYKVNSLVSYYYRWNGVKFQYHSRSSLNECELKQPSVAFDCYSLYNVRPCVGANFKHEKYADGSTFPSHSFFIGCDIGHLIMAALSTHFQLSESKELAINPGYQTSDDYIRSVFKSHSTDSTKQSFTVDSRFKWDCANVYEQYLAHRELARDFNGEQSQYATFDRSLITRRVRNAFFGVRHARVSNYLMECTKALCYNGDVELERNDYFPDVNKEAVWLRILKKLELNTDEVC